MWTDAYNNNIVHTSGHRRPGTMLADISKPALASVRTLQQTTIPKGQVVLKKVMVSLFPPRVTLVVRIKNV